MTTGRATRPSRRARTIWSTWNILPTTAATILPLVTIFLLSNHVEAYSLFDWCLMISGSIGTAGRPCNKTSKGIDGCDLLCCGRGYDTRRVLVTQPCHCTFKWCCSVECKTCTQWKDEHYCKPYQPTELEKSNNDVDNKSNPAST